MRTLLLILSFALAVALAFTWLAMDRQVSVTTERWSLPEGSSSLSPPGAETFIAPDVRSLTLPLARGVVLHEAQSGHLRIKLRGSGYNHKGVVVVRHEGAALRVVVQGDGPHGRPLDCKSTPPDVERECRLVVRVLDAGQTVVIVGPQAGAATISSVEFVPATSKRASEASVGDLYYGYLVLLVLGPVLVWLRRIPGAEQTALAGVGLAWIAWTGIIALVLSLAFALAGYAVIRGFERITNRRAKLLLLALSGIVLIILLVKFVGPYVSAVFANPGGFSFALPLGISYFAIRIVDLLLTAQAGPVKDLNLRDYLAFIFMPQTLPAGPILVYEDFQKGRIENYSHVDFAAGLARMCVGLAKKTIADTYVLPGVMKSMNVFLAGGDQAPPGVVAYMLLCNVLYVYLDFSAYCDIAIGAGRAAGRRIPENFNWPLLRSGMLAYWRHWHMTLSNWVMRRVYFAAFLTSRSPFLSILSSMMVIGLWHTPNASWAFWAFHHSVAMSAEQSFASRLKTPSQWETRPELKWRARLKYVAGVVFVWIWVGLGHSFTLFSSAAIALQSYLTALMTPISLVAKLL